MAMYASKMRIILIPYPRPGPSPPSLAMTADIRPPITIRLGFQSSSNLEFERKVRRIVTLAG